MRRRDFIRSATSAAALALPSASVVGDEKALLDRTQETAALPHGGSDLLARDLAEAHRNRLQLLTLIHHMRTPLNAIAGYADLMAERHSVDMPDDMTLALDRIATASQHLAELINSAFDPTRAERAD
jgi:signal transduction histidine kinase